MSTRDTQRISDLADTFLRKLRQRLGDDVMRAITSLNADEPDPGVCHSHDYCDANVIMDEAFVVVFGRSSRACSDRDAALWTRAWDLAKERMQQR
jgi:hypothetical protein